MIPFRHDGDRGSMRDRIVVIARDADLRGRLARLASRDGYRAEVAESFAHAHGTCCAGLRATLIRRQNDGSRTCIRPMQPSRYSM